MPASKNVAAKLGTAPVFLASISTILGAVMFLRFGYAVGHVGLGGTLWIILLGHLVTIPTALAIAEIATNRKVEGGGEYFIVSRSFGNTIGGAIGIPLYLSQAVSIAFYMIAFAEAFRPLSPMIERALGLPFDPRQVSIPATLLLVSMVYARGVNLGVAALWVVVSVLGLALISFFMGSPAGEVDVQQVGLFTTVDGPDPFMVVFAIIFPAFTGITAGVGLSGDLARPSRSLPLGILSATVMGLLVYVAQVHKLAYSASPVDLAGDQFIMQKIATWGPMIPIGLAAATLSSALGSVLVAPRTLQAMARDRIMPIPGLSTFLARGHDAAQEPRNATLVTGVLALFTVSLGNIDFVARIISMFFMVTYGSLCAISFLEHFAARPGYRPSFRSRWYISLLGALMCLFLMFQMDPVFAISAMVVMGLIYAGIQRSTAGQGRDLAAMFRGVFTQATRHMQIKLQRATAGGLTPDWRPSVITVDHRSFERTAPIYFLSQLCHRYGFATYLHFIQGQLTAETHATSRETLSRLIRSAPYRESSVYVDTIVSPSIRTALAQALQLPGVSGMENNSILFSCSTHDDVAVLQEICDECLMSIDARMNTLVLRHGDHFFGGHERIHIWLTWHDYHNANLMILLAYILIDHPRWREAEISIHAGFPREQAAEQTLKLRELISAGRIPVSERRIEIVPTDAKVDFPRLVQDRSGEADLVILGFTPERLRQKGAELLQRHPGLKDVLWVSAQERILIE